MRTVHAILVAAIVLACVSACESTDVGFEDRPAMQGPEENPVDDSERERPLPKGFVGDSATMILHRADCPRVSKGDPADRVFFVTPHPALNEEYMPCDYCKPLVGWK